MNRRPIQHSKTPPSHAVRDVPLVIKDSLRELRFSAKMGARRWMEEMEDVLSNIPKVGPTLGAATKTATQLLQFADRAVEIIADRGCNGRVSATEWDAVARGIRDAFGTGRYIAGGVAGLEVVSVLLARQFPRTPNEVDEANELPDRPVLL